MKFSYALFIPRRENLGDPIFALLVLRCRNWSMIQGYLRPGGQARPERDWHHEALILPWIGRKEALRLILLKPDWIFE